MGMDGSTSIDASKRSKTADIRNNHDQNEPCIEQEQSIRRCIITSNNTDVTKQINHLRNIVSTSPELGGQAQHAASTNPTNTLDDLSTSTSVSVSESLHDQITTTAIDAPLYVNKFTHINKFVPTITNAKIPPRASTARKDIGTIQNDDQLRPPTTIAQNLIPQPRADENLARDVRREPTSALVTHDTIIRTAERVAKRSRDRSNSDEVADYWPIGGLAPPPKRIRTTPISTVSISGGNRVKKSAVVRLGPSSANESTQNKGHLSQSPTSTPCKSVKHTNPGSQKLLSDFPLPSHALPPNWTLTQLCQTFPNHLIGDNLIPFLQYGWTAADIVALLPDQSKQSARHKVTQTVMAARLRKVKHGLNEARTFVSLVTNAPRLHQVGEKAEGVA